MNRTLHKILDKAWPHLVVLPFVVAGMLPAYFMAVNSFKDISGFVNSPLRLPTQWLIGNYQTLLFEKNFLRLIGNSAILTVFSIGISLSISCMAAYPLARSRFLGRSFLFEATSALMAVPPIVLIIPLFVLMSRLHLINSYASAIIVYTGLLVPFTVFFLTGFFQSIPHELIDAAKIDGCGELAIIFRIVFPLSRPALVTLAIVNGQWVWNELLIGVLFLTSMEKRPLMAGIALFVGRETMDFPLIMCASVLASIPMVAVLVFGQRYFIKGMLAGSLK